MFENLTDRLSQTLRHVTGKAKLTEDNIKDTLREVRMALLEADVALPVVKDFVNRVKERAVGTEVSKSLTPGQAFVKIVRAELEELMGAANEDLALNVTPPAVVLMAGLQGAGKTTTVGKLARVLVAEDKDVMLGAADTFRAAAIEQLKVWGERTKSPVIAGAQGSDSASLAFSALTAAKEQTRDVLLIDTAGRLQNKSELMNELEKVVRVIKKVDASAPHAVLLVLDATVGQNALSQVEAFHRTAGVTGLVMTKLDGTARGGILVALSEKHKLPVHFIGVGEGVEDLAPFTAKDFAKAIAGIEA